MESSLDSRPSVEGSEGSYYISLAPSLPLPSESCVIVWVCVLYNGSAPHVRAVRSVDCCRIASGVVCVKELR